ncbi:MAG: MiaB/RimO family radical SAM methylthiotransferase [Acidobacteriaceae bacterium]|jgi:threonylcarbamoyladenosine tRNA methylthiotransferase MtaB|nr:MiaB/RimO family radical SAM methylthiotransferase [Acidobacteriaceae bacterium]
MKYSVVTFGCRVNQADSLGFEEELIAHGATLSSTEDADLVIVNTCSVTANADQAARQTIRRTHRVNPYARIVVTGCYATRRPEEVGELPNVTHVVPNVQKADVIRLAVQPFERTTTATRYGTGDGACGSAIAPGLAGRTAFTLRVQTGCAESCSYCIIPATRGTPQSVPPDRVLLDVERVAAAGFKEIALTGVHLGSYGRDRDSQSSLHDLLLRLDAWNRCREGKAVLFRVSSLEPMDCTPDIVTLVAQSSSFAPHFHLPLQHASNRMLAAMRRPYTREFYDTLVNDICERIPDASIGSDVIVGFPGETDADVAALVACLEQSPLTHLHVFPYSDRPGTVASTLRDRPDPSAVRERAARVREIGRVLTSRFHARQIGRRHRALTIEDGSLAVTGNYLKVRIPEARPRNEWVHLQITAPGQAVLI